MILINPKHHGAGMFSYIWEVLRGIHRFPNETYYVRFGRESCYFDEQLYQQQDIDNVWEYYFEQLNEFHDNITEIVNISSDPNSEYRDVFMESDDYITRTLEYHNIINKHIKLLPHVSEKIEDFYNTYFKDKKILGIHCRGTDHPDKKDIEYYIDQIALYIDDYDYIFIASDEQYRVDCIKQAFGDKVIEYNVTTRSASSAPLHYHTEFQCSKYHIGEDVIIEAFLLAKTNYLLCCTGSNVNFFVRALNPNLPYKLLISYDNIK